VAASALVTGSASPYNDGNDVEEGPEAVVRETMCVKQGHAETAKGAFRQVSLRRLAPKPLPRTICRSPT